MALMEEEATRESPDNKKRFKREVSRKRKILHLKDGVTMEDLLDGWTQCCYYLEHKKRLCKLERSPNSQYCGQHRPLTDAMPRRLQRVADKIGVDQIERIPCPIDPGHTIYKHNLESHIAICNTRVLEEELRSQGYYCQDCNSGRNTHSSTDSTVDDMDLVTKIENTYYRIRDELQFYDASHQHHFTAEQRQLVLDTVTGTAQSFAKRRHGEQDLCIMNEMVSRDLLSVSTEDIFVEFGAGRGMLGLAVQCVAPQSHLLLVERKGVQHKADKTLRERNNNFTRVRMDIRHCNLMKLPGIVSENGVVTDKRIVIIAKHLCGLASDISIRSIHGASQSVGVAIATCCHHACSWEDYTGTDWFLQQGFTSHEFNIMKQWSSWAHAFKEYTRHDMNRDDVIEEKKVETSTADAEDDVEEVQEHQNVSKCVLRPNISSERMARIGKMIKRIFDHGRVEHLRSLGLHAQQVQYCIPELSPECFLILACKT